MTIIAFDGTNLAVDSRMTAGGHVITDDFQKLYEIDHPQLGPMICAVTGACDFIGPWLHTIQNEGFVPVHIHGANEEYSMSGLFIDRDGNAWQASTNGGFFMIGKEPTSLGTGTSIADYLMKKGKSAKVAVEEVCANNLFCGGVIRVYSSRTGKITTYE